MVKLNLEQAETIEMGTRASMNLPPGVQPVRPTPVADTLSKPFWLAASRGELAIQRCNRCGKYFHPPTVHCMQCNDAELVFQPVSGLGTVVAVTVMHEARVSGFEGVTPYTCVLVELDEQQGLSIASNYVGGRGQDVRAGTRVRAVFEPVDVDTVLPQFGPAS